jgi:mRNA interferase RelE/StbE
MIWRVQFTRTFLKEMASLPRDTRVRVETLVFGEDIKADPFLGGRTQKLTGYQTYYKIRVGDYRIGLHIDVSERLVEFQRVMHRREIYRKFP